MNDEHMFLILENTTLHHNLKQEMSYPPKGKHKKGGSLAKVGSIIESKSCEVQCLSRRRWRWVEEEICATLPWKHVSGGLSEIEKDCWSYIWCQICGSWDRLSLNLYTNRLETMPDWSELTAVHCFLGCSQTHGALNSLVGCQTDAAASLESWNVTDLQSVRSQDLDKDSCNILSVMEWTPQIAST